MAGRWAIAAAVAGVLAAGAQADEIVMKNKMAYTGVNIVDVSAGAIVYKLGSGSNKKLLADVAAIKLDDKGVEFNKAEQLAAGGKASEAVDAYDKAAEAFTADDWQMKLIRYRRMAQANAAGKTAKAVGDWLALAEESNYSRTVLAMRPTNLGKRGSEDVTDAIEMLTAKLEDLKSGEGRSTVGRLLVDLHLLQGNQAKADEVRKTLGAAPVTSTTASGGATSAAAAEKLATDDVPIPSGGSATLSAAAEDVKGKRYASAIQAIQGNLPRYEESELAKALLLLGKAQFLSVGKGGERRAETLREAGLNFMRAHIASPGGSEAAESMYMAARVCMALGNKTAAQNALRTVAGEYKGEWADKAKAALGGAADGPAEE